jgi:hypothetical protein
MATKILRIDKAALFRDLRYEPHQGQWCVHRSTAKRRVLACGSRWGKSMCAAMEGVAAVLQPAPSSRGWVVAPTLDLANRVFGQIKLTIAEHLHDHIIEVNEKDRLVRVCNLAGGTSVVQAKTADHPTSLLGEALDWLILDEAAAIPEDVWYRALCQRLIDRRGWSLVISTPRGAKGWFYREYRRGQKGRDPDYESWSAPTLENPYIPKDAIEAEKSRLSEDHFKQELGGEFVGALQDPCDVCNGPSRDVPGITILQPDDELAKCVECEKPVDADGQTLVKRWADGSVHMKVFQCVPDTLRDVSLPSNVQAVPDSAPK